MLHAPVPVWQHVHICAGLVLRSCGGVSPQGDLASLLCAEELLSWFVCVWHEL